MYCSRCGKPLLEDSRFCQYCGMPVELPVTQKHRKNWAFAVCIALLTTAILGVSGTGLYFAVNYFRENLGSGKYHDEKPTYGKQKDTDEKEEEIERSATRQADVYRKDNDSLYRAKTVAEIEGNQYALDEESKTASLIYAGNAEFPEKVEYNGNTYRLTEIDDYAVYNQYFSPDTARMREALIQGTVKIPNTVERIGMFAFANQTGLERIEIPESVKEIGSKAFYQCTSLSEVIIPDTVERIEGRAFGETKWAQESNDEVFIWKGTLVQYMGGFSQKEYHIPENVEEIGREAFCCCPMELKKVVIPDSVKVIGSKAFAECRALETIDISDNVEQIDGQAFVFTAWSENQAKKEFIWKKQFVQINPYGPTNAMEENYRVPDGVEVISSYAFESFPENGIGAPRFRSLEIPDTVQRIGEGAFWECGGITSLPKKLKEIGDYAFYGSIYTLNDGPDSVYSSHHLEVPEGTERIGKRAFSQCQYIASVKLPESLESISWDAFLGFPDPWSTSWRLRANYIRRNAPELYQQINNVSSFEAEWDLIYKTFRQNYPSTINLIVPEQKLSSYEALFTGRSQFDTELIITTQ